MSTVQKEKPNVEVTVGELVELLKKNGKTDKAERYAEKFPPGYKVWTGADYLQRLKDGTSGKNVPGQSGAGVGGKANDSKSGATS